MVGGCATGQINGNSAGAVGTSEVELVSQQGPPQQTITRPEGGKILVYEKQRMDHLAVMGAGAWSKPEQVYYWLDAQGKVEKVRYYPYGKRKFIFPSDQEREDVTPTSTKLTQAIAPLPPQAPTGASAPMPSPTTPPASVPTSVSSSRDMTAAARLELRMSKDDVARLLGLPDRTEGFWVEGKQVMVWTYRLKDQAGRQALTPLVFENGRLTGWGDAYYLTILRKVREQTH
jgi:hypothetical protein